jgi:hypothetical protein
MEFRTVEVQSLRRGMMINDVDARIRCRAL